VVEFNYIDNGTNKDIICVPCQTMCNMGCKFCHLTKYTGVIPTKNLAAANIIFGIDHIVNDLGLGKRKLLISFMGSGEPLDNINEVITTMLLLKQTWGTGIRFGMATMLPKKHWVRLCELMKSVMNHDLDLKVHLSLHFTTDEQRKEWMPSAFGIKESLRLLNLYGEMTGRPTEVHYTVIDDVNTRTTDLSFLIQNIAPETTIKLMRYSEQEELECSKADSRTVDSMLTILKLNGKTAEYYEPPGNDVGASCGQFVLEI
jgi:adenine C2-methylase RlmN of 23S rRNA A2503 and tRNA A37